MEERRRGCILFISVFIVPSLKPLLKFVGKAEIRACLNGSNFLSSFHTFSYILVHILGFSAALHGVAHPGHFVFSSKLRSVYPFSMYYFILSSTLEVGIPVFIIMPIFFWPCHVACRILLPRPGIEPLCRAVEAWSPNHWTTRNSHYAHFKGEEFIAEKFVFFVT